ncbi:Signal recognition particle receptor subunit beta [Tritrichomonas foetus]|uniref:Signal recognition particle receptor subunit beta n=1 Tax=Tritrichomonas foetus TaxID=1144522 RepID=A0A1J4JUD3_9EUKA|nr:Signal recognition particle receptor subunit beta [Tritrichomonas foetus]|eukprot:OHT02322.1 Signal recognition particle receptor subunit beta [Tritrichomonas foetus]
MELDITLLITIGIIVVTVIVGLVLFLNRAPKVKNVYLVGLTGSGKTTLFYKIVAKEKMSTITSQVRNSFTIQENKKTLNLIDLPGHPRIRTEVMNSIKTASAIIFTIDSETVLKYISDVANFLYDILSEPEITKNKVPLLILATKSDIDGARDIDLIQQELEKEIDFIRSNRLKSNYVEDGESEQLFIGEEGKDFAFSQLINPVSYGACSHTAIDQVQDFINVIMRK